MSEELEGKTIAFIATDGVEQIEYTAPRDAVSEAGASTELLALADHDIQGYNHLDKGQTFAVDYIVGEADLDRYDALVLPGGVANPDALRTQPSVRSFVQRFIDTGKPVAASCHAPWTLIDAERVDGRRMTSWPSLEADLRNAGAEWVDEQVVVDGNLITSRKPDDLKAFSSALIKQLEAQ